MFLILCSLLAEVLLSFSSAVLKRSWMKCPKLSVDICLEFLNKTGLLINASNF